MELLSTSEEETSSGRLRLVGTVAYDDRPGLAQDYWFEVPPEHADSVTGSANPWLVCLTPLAVQLREPLRIPLPVDALLLRNIEELMAVWSSWYPELIPISVVADAAPSPPEGVGRTGLFFSGGVDSFFSSFQNDEDEPGRFPADDEGILIGR